jgi:glycosyltransferase involved in cell wall biosynthesis
MPRLVACYSVYKEIEFIEESLNSVVDLVDFLILVDGAYVDWPDRDDYSSDGTKEFVTQRIGSKGVLIEPQKRLTQSEKRNLYLKYAEDRFSDAWVLVIDGDEILRGAQEDFQWLRSPESEAFNIAKILIRNNLEAQEGTRLLPRLYRKIPGLHYTENHLTLRDKLGFDVNAKYPSLKLEGVWLEHKRALRNYDRKIIRDRYYTERGLPRWS